MAIQYRSTGTSGNSGASAVTSQAITLPTGFAAGDLLFMCIRIGSTAVTNFHQSAGTGTWAIDFEAQYATGGFTYAVAHRAIAAGDTAPTFAWTTSGQTSWSCGGFLSTTGLLSVDQYAAGDPAENGSAATSIIPNAVSGGGGPEASIILTLARAATAHTTTSHTYTPPSGWTWTDGDAAFFSSGSANARIAAHCFQLGVSDTVTPGSQSLTDSASDTFFFAVFHALVRETNTLRQRPYMPPRRVPARAYVRFTPVATTNGAGVTPPSGTVQPQPTFPVPRRKPARAVWHGVAAPGPGPLPPRQMPPLPRRKLARAYVQFTPVVTTNAVVAGVAVAAPVQLPPVPRRKPARAYVQFRAVATVNAAFVPRGQPPLAPDDKPHLKKLLYLVG